jgi:hypothetical protein
MLKVAVLISLFYFAPSISIGQTSSSIHYFAGFKTLNLKDTTRTYKPNTHRNDRLHFRPIDVDIWYPSNEKGKEPITFGDLFRLFEQRAIEYQEDTDYTGLTEELAAFYVAQLGIGTNAKLLLDIRTQSFADLIPSDEQHPTIMYMAGFNGMGFENYKLLEKPSVGPRMLALPASVASYIAMSR